MTVEDVTIALAREIVTLLRDKGLTLATAESCTGGAVASAVTKVAGCSDVVAYSNSVKQNVLGVNGGTLEKYGAVSEEVVREMVQGVSARLAASCAVATSGIAGPGGGTAEKPVGTVWIAIKVGDDVVAELLQIGDSGREENIKRSVHEVLLMLKCMLDTSSRQSRV